MPLPTSIRFLPLSIGLLLSGVGQAAAQDLELRFLDVGQGNAVLLRVGDKAALVGVGPTDRVASRLRALGVESAAVRVTSGNLRVLGGDTRLRILPGTGVLVERGRFRALLTEVGEPKATDVPDLDVLQAARYGSRQGVPAGWLARTRPEVVVISVGADNPHGYPHRAALSAYKTPGRRVFRTDQDGDVVIRVKPDGSYTARTERTRGGTPPAAPRSANRSAPSPPTRAASTSGSEASSRSLLVPVQGVPRSKLVDTYTQARTRGRPHNAIDIAAPRGTPVVAVTGGRVLKLFKSVQGGIALYQLDPDGRTVYYYAHLDRYAPGMREGKTLRRGEVLGYVGNTGNSGAGNYHLHFGISITPDPKRYWGGRNINPYPRLRGTK